MAGLEPAIQRGASAQQMTHHCCSFARDIHLGSPTLAGWLAGSEAGHDKNLR
jgi:hypothetical protein